jgi:hypothetical protein
MLTLMVFLGRLVPLAKASSSCADGKEEGSSDLPSGTCIQPPLTKWLNALSFAESGNRPQIVHQDRDGRLYYGCLQFRERTFRFYVKKFNLAPNAQAAEVMALIYDCRFQKRLATRMIHDNPDNWKHWRYTVERIGLPPRPICPSDPIDVEDIEPE